MADLWIANTVRDLIQGDVHEHLPLEKIPLKGDVLGLGATASIDNGELSFLQQPGDGDTTIWKFQASDGRIRALRPGDGSSDFLGRSLEWYCCGFFDTDPSQGRVTVPDPHAHLHLHVATAPTGE